MKKGGFRSRIDPKSPLNEETRRENLEKKIRADLLKRKQELS